MSSTYKKEKSLKIFGYEITETHIHLLVVAYAVIMSFASYDNLFGKIVVATPKIVVYGIGIWQAYLGVLLLKSLRRTKRKK